MTIDVTIAVPVYNVEKYVKRCLESIFAQQLDSDRRIDLLIIDDCSTDRSMKIVHEQLQKAPTRFACRVVSHPQNMGLADARNTAIKEAKGEFLWFVDSDDYVSPTMLEQMLKAAKSDVDVVITNVQTVDDHGNAIDIGLAKANAAEWTGMEALSNLHRRRIYAFMWNKLIRTALYDNQHFPSGKIYEDLAVMGAILLRSRRVVQLSERHYYYVIRSNAITSHYRPDITDLIDNVKLGVARVQTGIPDATSTAMIDNYIARESWLPVMNSIAKARLGYRERASTIKYVANEIELSALYRLLRHGYYLTAISSAMVKFTPRLYLSIYRNMLIRRGSK